MRKTKNQPDKCVDCERYAVLEGRGEGCMVAHCEKDEHATDTTTQPETDGKEMTDTNDPILTSDEIMNEILAVEPNLRLGLSLDTSKKFKEALDRIVRRVQEQEADLKRDRNSLITLVERYIDARQTPNRLDGINQDARALLARIAG